MPFLNHEHLLKAITNDFLYNKTYRQMIEDVNQFITSFTDDPKALSGIATDYYCQIDQSPLIFNYQDDINHECALCGNQYDGENIEQAWRYWYRNEAILTAYKAAFLFKVNQDKKFLKYAKQIINFYADHYLDFRIHNLNGKYETLDKMSWNSGRIMASGEDEALVLIRLINTLEILREDLDEDYLDELFEKIFKPAFTLLKCQVNKINTACCLMNIAISLIGLFYDNLEMLKFAFNSTDNLYIMMDEMITSGHLWDDGILHHHFLVLENLLYLIIYTNLYQYALTPKYLKKIEKMVESSFNLAFNNHQLPRMEANLKSYAYLFALATKVFGNDQIIKNIWNKTGSRIALPQPYYFENKISLERLMFLSEVDFYEFKKQSLASVDFGQSAIIRNKKMSIFMKYGKHRYSDTSKDCFNLEIQVMDKMLVRKTHVLCNNLSLVTRNKGQMITFNDTSMNAQLADVFNVPKSVDVGKLLQMMDEEAVKNYLMNDYSLSVREAEKAISNKSVVVGNMNAVNVNFTREVQIFDNGFKDLFTAEAVEVCNYEYLFHCEAELLTKLRLEETSSNVYRAKTTAKELKLLWQLDDLQLESKIELKGKTLFVLDQDDNSKTTFMIRAKGDCITFLVEWKIIK